MKIQDLAKYRSMTPADLAVEINKRTVELSEVILKQALMQDKNVKKAKNLKIEIAKLKTLVRFHQLTNNNK